MKESYGDGKKNDGVSDDKLLKVTVPFGTILDYGNGLYEVPQGNTIEIKVAFDFTAERPPFGANNDWWSVDTNTGIVHVQFHEESRKRYVELMDKKFAHEELSHEESNELETVEVLLNVLPQTAASKAVQNYAELYKAMQGTPKEDNNEDSATDDKKEYRTKKTAGEVDEVPAFVPAITNSKFQNAMTLNTDSKAYLQPFSSVDSLVFENGQLLFEGMPATAATLKRYFTQDGIETFNLPLLRVFYAIILNRFAKTWTEDKSIEEVVTIYYPDLAKQLGKSANISQKDVDECINNIISFQTIMGIVDKGKRGNDILPVLVYMGNDSDKNTISFASPYMVRVIRDIYNASIRKSKQGLPLLKKSGEPQLLPAYSYMIKTSIAKEKNKKAVEIVFIVVALIEQAGNNVAHIKASTIIERNQLLRQAIESCKTPGNVNNHLTRAFSKAWELLSTQTNLKEYYKNIVLPDVKAKDFKANWIPTSATLDKVFKFKHDGKK